MGFWLKTPQDEALAKATRHLDRIATALETIVRESYGINLNHEIPDLSLEISYTDPELEDEPRPSYSPTPAIGDPDPEPDE